MELSYGDGKRMEMLMENYFRKLNLSIEELKQRIERIEKKLDELRLPPGPHPPRPEIKHPEFGHPADEQLGLQGREKPMLDPHSSLGGQMHHQENPDQKVEPKQAEVFHNRDIKRPDFKNERPKNERTGSLKPGDISIEKYFYAGKH